jgi:hypothetical protein
LNVASFLAELRRRNVLRTGALYIGGLWALAQGIASLGPVFNAPDWITRWVVIGGAIGFPFWLLFAWFFELTPEGLRLEHDLARAKSPCARRVASSIWRSSACSRIAVVAADSPVCRAKQCDERSDPGKSIAVAAGQQEAATRTSNTFPMGSRKT